MLVFLQRVVPREHVRMGFAEMFRELLGNVHRTMLTPGAADGDGQIAAIRLRKLADALFQESDQIGNNVPHAGVAREIVDHG